MNLSPTMVVASSLTNVRVAEQLGEDHLRNASINGGGRCGVPEDVRRQQRLAESLLPSAENALDKVDAANDRTSGGLVADQGCQHLPQSVGDRQHSASSLPVNVQLPGIHVDVHRSEPGDLGASHAGEKHQLDRQRVPLADRRPALSRVADGSNQIEHALAGQDPEPTATRPGRLELRQRIGVDQPRSVSEPQHASQCFEFLSPHGASRDLARGDSFRREPLGLRNRDLAKWERLAPSMGTGHYAPRVPVVGDGVGPGTGPLQVEQKRVESVCESRIGAASLAPLPTHLCRVVRSNLWIVAQRTHDTLAADVHCCPVAITDTSDVARQFVAHESEHASGTGSVPGESVNPSLKGALMHNRRRESVGEGCPPSNAKIERLRAEWSDSCSASDSEHGTRDRNIHVPCPACGLRYTPASMRPLPRFAASAFDGHTPICPVCYHFATRPGMTVRDGLRWVGVLPVLEWALLLAGVSLIAFAVARWIGGGA